MHTDTATEADGVVVLWQREVRSVHRCARFAAWSGEELDLLSSRPDPHSIEVTVRPSLDAEFERLVREARQAAEDARSAQELSSTRMRSTVRALRTELTTRDVASVLGVSLQRVSQLEHAPD